MSNGASPVSPDVAVDGDVEEFDLDLRFIPLVTLPIPYGIEATGSCGGSCGCSGTCDVTCSPTCPEGCTEDAACTEGYPGCTDYCP
jgi:hypothetical protein